MDGDADAGGRDDVAGSVAAAQANAEARYREYQADTYQQGSALGDLVPLAPPPPRYANPRNINTPEGA